MQYVDKANLTSKINGSIMPFCLKRQRQHGHHHEHGDDHDHDHPRTPTNNNRRRRTATNMNQAVRACLGLLSFQAILGGYALMPPNPEGWHQVQPDGNSTAHLHLQHGPNQPYMADQHGRPIVIDDNGWYVYATRNGASSQVDSSSTRKLRTLRPTSVRVGKDEPPPFISNSNNNNDGIYPLHYYPDLLSCHPDDGDQDCETISKERKLLPKQGKVKSLVLLLRFADHKERELPSRAEYDTLFNSDQIHPGVTPTGSVRELYKVNSYGKLDLEFHVEDWFDVPFTEEEMSFGRNGMTGKFAEIAFDKLDEMYNNDSSFEFWSQFDTDRDAIMDSLVLLHSGYSGEAGGTDCINNKPWGSHRIWSHAINVNGDNVWNPPFDRTNIRTKRYVVGSGVYGYCGSGLTRIGLLSHELGHSLGIIDLISDEGSGIGHYGLMGMAWGWNSQQLYPSLFSAWSKIKLGWAQPIELSSASSGEYSIRAAHEHEEIYKVTSGFPENEYLLIENRQRESFDAAMPGNGGLLIWHIDENAKQSRGADISDGGHYKVAVVQADGNQDLELGINNGDGDDLFTQGDVLREGTNDNFPNTDSYQQGSDVEETGNRIMILSPSNAEMTFQYTYLRMRKPVLWVGRRPKSGLRLSSQLIDAPWNDRRNLRETNRRTTIQSAPTLAAVVGSPDTHAKVETPSDRKKLRRIKGGNSKRAKL